MYKALSASETRTAIQARIEGLQYGQVDTVNRLRRCKIPEDLIQAAAHAHEEPGTPADQQEAYEAAESYIIATVMERHGKSIDDAIAFLNN